MRNAAIPSKNSDENKEMSGLSPVNPFRSLLVHFGMLLGVDDFETIDGYHRGKMWLHNAWLHGRGTIWGLEVRMSKSRDEVQVDPGLAVDGLGRELFLEAPACLNVGAWYEEHKTDPELQAVVDRKKNGAVCFDAHVMIRFKGCLARQVPALTEPCDSSGATTAYSRVIETVELLLLPGKAPEWRTPPGALPYHRLRLLFGLEEPIRKTNGAVVPADQEVLDALADILALAVDKQPAAYLEAFRRFSALDAMDLGPAVTEEGDGFALFPVLDPDLISLADISGLTLVPLASGGWNLTDGEIDNTVRPVHLPTATIQELLCGPRCSCPSDLSPSPVHPPVTPVDAGGPRIESDSVSIRGEKITFRVARSPLLQASVHAEGLSISSFDLRDGWRVEDIDSVAYDNDSRQVTIQLRNAPGGTLMRLIVRGTGPSPFLGRNRIPLAGAVGGPAGGEMDGNDFVFMFKKDERG